MWIERVQVEEGFLDGLDVTFSPGLNVIVGARGVGKTSVLELIRYALRLPHVDDRRASSARQHAETILAGGRVLLTFVEGDQRSTVSRSAADAEGAGVVPAPDLLPLMLGQNELEGIGLDPRSRLRLVDAHAGVNVTAVEAAITRVSAQAQSLTLQLHALALQREGLRQQEMLRPNVERDLAAARAEEAALLNRASAEVANLRQRLGESTARIATLRRDIAAVEELGGQLTALEPSTAAVVEALRQLESDVDSGSLGDAAYAPALHALVRGQDEVAQALASLKARVADDLVARRQEVAQADDEVRPLRRQFDEFEVGATAAAQRTARLEQQLIDIAAGTHRAAALDARADDLRKQRDSIMHEVDAVRESLWARREAAAVELSRSFEPRIRIQLEHYGDRTAYVSALSAALRGSGLQQNQLAVWLAERISPQELVAAVEEGDAARLAMLGEVTSARVEKLVAHLSNSEGLGSILTAPVQDLADILLLVGRDYRNSEQLSTGQRCSVVLPLLLADPVRVLLLDQPEDHLDNAYLVENTVRTLLTRSNKAQTIIATHNANIPVLGNANFVVTLDSDGRRGYIKNHGDLFSPSIVEAISELLEGGREAFARRSNFYDGASTPE
jgi:chromosome segregation ATPase